jgi:hypothetical protein
MANANALMVAKVLGAIGNVVESAEIGGVLYTLAVDRVVRVNDADTGDIVYRIQYPTYERAEAAYSKAVEDARKAEVVPTDGATIQRLADATTAEGLKFFRRKQAR